MGDIKITGASTLASEDVERMVKEAEKYAEEDKKKREEIDTKNQGDSLIYQTRKQLSELTKIPEDLRKQIEEKVKELEEVMKTDNVANIKTSIDDLQKEVVNIGQAVYNQQETTPESKGPADSEPKGNNKDDNDVI